MYKLGFFIQQLLCSTGMSEIWIRSEHGDCEIYWSENFNDQLIQRREFTCLDFAAALICYRFKKQGLDELSLSYVKWGIRERESFTAFKNIRDELVEKRGKIEGIKTYQAIRYMLKHFKEDSTSLTNCELALKCSPLVIYDEVGDRITEETFFCNFPRFLTNAEPTTLSHLDQIMHRLMKGIIYSLNKNLKVELRDVVFYNDIGLQNLSKNENEYNSMLKVIRTISKLILDAIELTKLRNEEQNLKYGIWVGFIFGTKDYVIEKFNAFIMFLKSY